MFRKAKHVNFYMSLTSFRWQQSVIQPCLSGWRQPAPVNYLKIDPDDGGNEGILTKQKGVVISDVLAETETHNFRCNYTIKSARITLAIISAIKKAQGGDASQRTITNRNLCLIDLGIQAWSQNLGHDQVLTTL